MDPARSIRFGNLWVTPGFVQPRDIVVIAHPKECRIERIPGQGAGGLIALPNVFRTVSSSGQVLKMPCRGAPGQDTQMPSLLKECKLFMAAHSYPLAFTSMAPSTHMEVPRNQPLFTIFIVSIEFKLVCSLTITLVLSQVPQTRYQASSLASIITTLQSRPLRTLLSPPPARWSWRVLLAIRAYRLAPSPRVLRFLCMLVQVLRMLRHHLVCGLTPQLHRSTTVLSSQWMHLYNQITRVIQVIGDSLLRASCHLNLRVSIIRLFP